MTGGQIDQFEFKTNDSASGNVGGDEGAAGGVVGLHVLENAFAFVKNLKKWVGILAGHLKVEGFPGLKALVIFVALHNDGRAGNENFESFTAHCFHENGDLHRATSGNIKDTRDF